MNASILFVASSQREEGQVEAAFGRAGYSVVLCPSFTGGRRALQDGKHALVIIDATLPDGAGIDLLVSAASTPAVLLTEDLDVTDRLMFLRAGAADCVGKPYDPLHLVARAVSVCNRQRGVASVAAPGFARRLMVVDDSTTYAQALAEELRRDGHDVAVARTAHDALAYLAVQELDLAIVDAFLPDMNGADLCSRMRGIHAVRRTPVLLLTGREKSMLKSRAVDATELAVKSRDLESVRMQARRLLASEEWPAPSSRRSPAPASHRSVPPPSRRDGAPASHRSVPPPSRRDGEPSSHRSVPPPPSRRDVGPSSHRSVPPPSAREGPPSSQAPSPLFEQVAFASGLSRMVGRPSIERACRRAGVDPKRLTPADLQRALPEIELALRAFLPPDLAESRMAEIGRLTRG